MKATLPVAVPPGTRLVQLHYEEATKSWIMWLHYETQMRHGTYLRLLPDGKIERVIAHPDGSEDLFRVR